MLLTRQGISLSLVTSSWMGEPFRFRSPLHVAMQLGPYHSPMATTEDLAYGL
jgi:hypothetical protein